jgi:hypothetical protein
MNLGLLEFRASVLTIISFLDPQLLSSITIQINRKPLDQNREEQERLEEIHCVKSCSTSSRVKSEAKNRRK